MGKLRELCTQHTKLTNTDICRLEELERVLPLIADVSNADVFLDCLVDTETAVVVAQASPSQGVSAYQKNIVGEYATKANEPAVFQAFHMGVPVCDLKAVTQEMRSVRQNVAQVRNNNDEIIALLIREKDISSDLQRQRKYEELAKDREETTLLSLGTDSGSNSVAVREMHHRVKNNLQLVASILNLQARKTDNEVVKTALRENVSRVLSIAAVHDILLNSSGNMSTLSMRTLLDSLRHNLLALVPPERDITLSVTCDDIELDTDAATSAALCITELVTNAFEHGFCGRTEGRVEVIVGKGELYHTVAVIDNGVGFDPAQVGSSSLGLRIVESTVRDKLKGKMHIATTPGGTKISFDIKR